MAIARWLKNLWGGKKRREKDTVNRNEKQRWTFTGKFSSRRSASRSPTASELRTQSYRDVFHTEKEKDQNMHAIAVAAATAAAADAAVLAAQAAAAVVTSQGRISGLSGIGRERRAAVKIQTLFRGYLAKKALRALKGLVKLQAYVRGYLVRREAAKTFHSMQALFRAEVAIRLHQAHSSIGTTSKPHRRSRRHRSFEWFDDTISENVCSNMGSLSALEGNCHGQGGVAEIPKNIEVDSFRQKSWPLQISTELSESFASSPASESFSSHPPVLSPSSVPYGRTLDQTISPNPCRFANAQNRPRFRKPEAQDIHRFHVERTSSDGMNRKLCSSPNYMISTKSFQAKSRSQSTPKQRPGALEKRIQSLQETVEAPASMSGLRVPMPGSPAHEASTFKNIVVNRLNRSTEPGPHPRFHSDYIFAFQTFR